MTDFVVGFIGGCLCILFLKEVIEKREPRRHRPFVVRGRILH